jgi:hypothetical protein
MSRQLLIYETAVPVSASRHGDCSLASAPDFAFSAAVNAVPLMAAEFLRAAVEYAIVFTKSGDVVMPAVVLGVRGNENLYLGADKSWQADYIPAFIRRYPFVFSSSSDGKTLTLCIDESHPGVNRQGRGERLFGDDGQPAPYVERVLKFLQEYQSQYERTRAFCRQVDELGLLEPMQAEVSTPRGGKLSLNGFFGVSRARLRALPADTLARLAKTDELELLYLQLHSLRNFNDVKDRLIGMLKDDAAALPSPVPQTLQ